MLDLPYPALSPSYVYVQEASYAPSYAPSAIVEAWLAQNVQPSTFSSQISAERQIAGFSNMLAGWDGHGAAPITLVVEQNSLLVLQRILAYAPLQDITPNPNGTISFEWETDLGFAALEVGQTRISFFVKTQAGDTILLDGTVDNISSTAIRAGIVVADTLFPSLHTAKPITRILATPYVSHTS